MSRDPIQNELRGLDSWITREPIDDAGSWEEPTDNRPGVLSSIIKAIDAYTAQNDDTLDLSAANGWQHRDYLAMAIADALAADGHVDPDTV